MQNDLDLILVRMRSGLFDATRGVDVHLFCPARIVSGLAFVKAGGSDLGSSGHSYMNYFVGGSRRLLLEGTIISPIITMQSSYTPVYTRSSCCHECVAVCPPRLSSSLLRICVLVEDTESPNIADRTTNGEDAATK